MRFPLFAVLVAIGLFVSMLLLLEAGRRIGKRMMRDPGEAPAGVGTVEGAVFGLMGLLIAFTFSGAASRFDTRRHLIVEEANNIGTAWLRVDLLPSEMQPQMRQLFRTYLDSRLKVYQKLPDIQASKVELARSEDYQKKIWNHAVGGCSQTNSPQCAMLLLPALNQMIDITTTRTLSTQFHPPAIIFVMLGLLTLAASALAGYSMSAGKRSWIHILGFSAVLAVTVYVIVNIEFPRFGLIRVDATDQVLRDLLNRMK
jgi:hypothetical protein